MRSLDDAWISAFICGKIKVSLGDLELALQSDPDAWRQILQFLLVSSLSLKLIDDNRKKSITATALEYRIDSMDQDRCSVFRDREFLHNTSKSIDWATLGVYDVVWESGANKAEAIKHRPSGDVAVLPEHITTTTDFVIDHNWADYGATIGLKPTRYDIAQAFFTDKSKGPHITPLMTHKMWLDLTAKAKVSVQRAEENARPVVEPAPAFMAKAKELSRKLALEKARAALDAKKHDLHNERVVQVTR